MKQSMFYICLLISSITALPLRSNKALTAGLPPSARFPPAQIRPQTRRRPVKAHAGDPAGAQTYFDGPGKVVATNDPGGRMSTGTMIDGVPKTTHTTTGDSAFHIAHVFAGGKSTASGLKKVSASFQNGPFTHGCIDCIIPGEDPIKIRGGPNANMRFSALNPRPELGPARIQVDQDGFGHQGVFGSNVKVD